MRNLNWWKKSKQVNVTPQRSFRIQKYIGFAPWAVLLLWYLQDNFPLGFNLHQYLFDERGIINPLENTKDVSDVVNSIKPEENLSINDSAKRISIESKHQEVSNVMINNDHDSNKVEGVITRVAHECWDWYVYLRANPHISVLVGATFYVAWYALWGSPFEGFFGGHDGSDASSDIKNNNHQQYPENQRLYPSVSNGRLNQYNNVVSEHSGHSGLNSVSSHLNGADNDNQYGNPSFISDNMINPTPDTINVRIHERIITRENLKVNVREDLKAYAKVEKAIKDFASFDPDTD